MQILKIQAHKATADSSGKTLYLQGLESSQGWILESFNSFFFITKTTMELGYTTLEYGWIG